MSTKAGEVALELLTCWWVVIVELSDDLDGRKKPVLSVFEPPKEVA